jgi:hypothetical protein
MNERMNERTYYKDANTLSHRNIQTHTHTHTHKNRQTVLKKDTDKKKNRKVKRKID